MNASKTISQTREMGFCVSAYSMVLIRTMELSLSYRTLSYDYRVVDQTLNCLEKLRALNIPEEVIANLDARNGGNIDEEGNVLFLDEERQKRKEHPEKPMWKNKPDGLGIKNFILKKYQQMQRSQMK